MPTTEVNDEYTETIDGDEFVEVKDDGGGDFPPVHDWDDGPILGSYKGSKEVTTKNGLSTIHSFDVDGEELQCWGTTLLSGRLADVEPGSRVKVIKTGNKIPTKSGHKANEFKVLVARSALAGR